MNASAKCFLPITAVCGLLVASCTSTHSRADFEVPALLPALQIVSDMDSTFEREKLAMKSKNSSNDQQAHLERHHADLFAGLMVPVTEDGYCLTAAHNLGKGKSMGFVTSQIGHHDFGKAFVMTNLKRGSSPPFCGFDKGEIRVMTATKTGNGLSNRFVVRRAEATSVTMLLSGMDRERLEALESQKTDQGELYFLPIRQIKIWEEDDLALVKVPFETPAHLKLSDSETPVGDPLMVFTSPGTHRGTINHVTERTKYAAKLPLSFPTFTPLAMTHLSHGKQGDSGGPVINRAGELVGLNLATYRGGKTPAIDLAVRIQPRPILEAIQKSR